jgi:hypothetical protein
LGGTRGFARYGAPYSLKAVGPGVTYAFRPLLMACEKTVVSEGRSCCILDGPNRTTHWPWLSAGAQDRFARSETEREPRRSEWDEQPDCILKCMRIPSIVGMRDR